MIFSVILKGFYGLKDIFHIFAIIKYLQLKNTSRIKPSYSLETKIYIIQTLNLIFLGA